MLHPDLRFAFLLEWGSKDADEGNGGDVVNKEEREMNNEGEMSPHTTTVISDDFNIFHFIIAIMIINNKILKYNISF